MASFTERYGAWALVLGASEGLGAALATEAARRGFNVAMVARREPVLKAKARQIAESFGVQTKTIAADMADPDVIQVLERGLGGDAPGFMIYNCAAEFGGRFLDVDLEKQRTNILVNCWTPVQLAHHFGGKMCAEGW
jgi:short-subunit dehydrogenase